MIDALVALVGTAERTGRDGFEKEYKMRSVLVVRVVLGFQRVEECRT